MSFYNMTSQVSAKVQLRVFPGVAGPISGKGASFTGSNNDKPSWCPATTQRGVYAKS